MILTVYCIVNPENMPLLDTVGEEDYISLHKFDMLQPVSWPLAEQQGFRLVEFVMKPIN